ncbi:MAG: hypothetical protein ACWA49_06330 [Ruegeria sp.]
MRYFRCFAVLLSLALPGSVALAQQADPHDVYETKCSGCHEDHASDFVRDRFELDQAELVIAKSGSPLEGFLESGHGGAGPDEIDGLVRLLTQIRLSDGLFQSKCKICHVRAKETARLKLFIRDDRLVGRYTGRDIEAFLHYHGRLDPAEIPIMLAALRFHVLTKPAM